MRKLEGYAASSSGRLRSGALACAVGGALFAMWGYVHKDDYTPLYLNAVAHVLALIVPMLFMMGLVALYGVCAGRAGPFAQTGIVLGSVGASLGAVRALVDLAVPSLYPLDALSAQILLLLLRVWTPTLFMGLLLVGLGFLATRTLRGFGVLLFAMGAFGWVFRLTDAVYIFEARSVHVGFGLLFSLGWVVLGLMLWAASEDISCRHFGE